MSLVTSTSTGEGCRKSKLRFDSTEQVIVFLDGGELRELLLNRFGSAKEKTSVRGREHGGVIEGITRRDDIIIQCAQRFDCFSFLLSDAQFVVRDLAILNDEAVTKQGRPAK